MRSRDHRTEARFLAAAAAAAGVVWWAFIRYGVLAWAVASLAMYGITLRPRVRRRLRWSSVRRANLPAAAGPLAQRLERTAGAVLRAAVGGGRRGFDASRRAAGMARARRAAQRLRPPNWHGICKEAGWLKDGDAPSLLGVDVVAPDAIRVTWRPWNSTDPSDYTKHAATIMRSIDAQTVRAHPDLERTGVAVANIGLRVLPKMVRLRRVPGPAGVGPDAAFTLGPFAGGGDAVWRPAQRPHVLIIGGTDKGKGGAARLIMAQAACAPRDLAWDVHFANTKRSGEAGWMRGLPWAWDHAGDRAILDCLQRLEARRQSLQGVLLREGLDKWSDVPERLRAELGWRRVLLCIDEMASLSIGADSSIAERISTTAAVLVMQMRAVGWHMLGMTQRPDAKALGPLGGLFRSQLKGAWLIVGGTDASGLRMVADDAKALQPLLGLLGGVQGRALGSGFDDGDHVNVLQLGWLEQATVVGAVRSLAAGDTEAATVDTVDAVDMTTTPAPMGRAQGPDMDMVDTVDAVAGEDGERQAGVGDAPTTVACSETAGGQPGAGDVAACPDPSAEDAAAPASGPGSGGGDGAVLAAGEQATTVDELAAELDKSGRQVRRYAHGQSPPPAGVASVRWLDRGAGRVAVRRR